MTFDGGVEAGCNNSAVAFIKGTELHRIAFPQTYGFLLIFFKCNFLDQIFLLVLKSSY